MVLKDTRKKDKNKREGYRCGRQNCQPTFSLMELVITGISDQAANTSLS